MKSAFSDDEIFSASASLRILGGKIESDNVFDLVENTRRRILIIKRYRKLRQNIRALRQKFLKILWDNGF